MDEDRDSFDPNIPQAMDTAALRALGMAGLDACFAGLDAPEPEELQGVLRGCVVATVVDELIGAHLGARALGALDPVLGLWAGKRFEGFCGTNVWLTDSGAIRLTHYRIYHAAALDDPREVVRLDYNVPENAPPLQLILGELRRLGPGLMLGRMSLVRGGGWLRLLYFTLET